MTTPEYRPILKVSLTPSRWQARLFGAVHLCAAALLLATDIVWGWQLALVVLVIGYGIFAWRRLGWSRRVTQLEVGNVFCSLTLRRPHSALDEQIPVHMQPYLVAPGLLILKIHTEGRRRFLPLFRDSAPPDELRRLRVLLRSGFSHL